MSGDRVDIIIFAASGFTGKSTIPQVHKLSKAEGRNLTWAVSGRSHDKLKQVLEEYAKKLDADFSSIPIITADIKDEESLVQMASRGKVVINCCGPYRFYGEPVVKACIEAGTHHVDVSGEPQYMERMQLEYFKKAQEKGVYVVSACGFDSIPTDLGVVFLESKFGGTLNSVETYLESHVDGKVSGASFNFGTWESAVYGLAHSKELRPLRTKLYPEKLPTFEPKLKRKPTLCKSDVTNTWVVPFPGSDRSVVLRSQRFLYELENKRPVQIQTYFAISSLQALFFLSIFGAIFALLARFSFGRKLLLKHPKFFSFGMFSHEGPSEETQEKTHFSVTLCGQGWKEKLTETTDKYKTPMDKTVVARVSGVNPGYGATCVALTLAAIVTITETNKLPDKGGVFPPGAAFAKTSLIEQLQKNGLVFEILAEK